MDWVRPSQGTGHTQVSRRIMTQATAKTGGQRRVARWLAWLGVLLGMAVAGIAVALRETHSQTVNGAGQVITVGATAPTLSLSGPGEIDLFGQSLPTNLPFVGPVRPRLQLAQITINSER